MDGESWTIGGLPARVPASAVGREQVRLNEQVTVTGRLLDNGTWLVDILQPASLISNEFSLTAQLNDFGDTAITVGTHRLGITDSSIFNDGTNLGQYVTVQVMAQADGQVHVTAVVPLADGDSLLVTITPSATASATMTMTATATATILPTPDASGQVTICHIPPGNPANARTIHVGYGSLRAHLGHGDTVGLCPGETATPTISSTLTITATATLSATPTLTATATPTLTVTPSITPDPGNNPEPTAEPETQLTICHIPEGNPDNVQTITIDASSWPAHQAHGDYLGACNSTGNPDGGGTSGNGGGTNNGGTNNGSGGNGNGGGGGSGGNNGGGNSGGNGG